MDDDGYWEDLLPWGQAAPACALSLMPYRTARTACELLEESATWFTHAQGVAI